MKRKIEEQPKVGTFLLGMTNVDVYGVTNEGGGWFFCAPDEKSLPRIKIGLRYRSWSQVVAILCHESFEYLTAQYGARFQPDDNSGGTDRFRFFFNHDSFSTICEYQGQFLAAVLPDLAIVWKKYKPK